MATIKVVTMGDTPRFVHNGLTVTSNWTELDLDTLNDESRQALVDYVGRFVRVHDDDVETFRSYLSQNGMRYEDGKVVDPQREERERKAAEEAARTAKGTMPGRPAPPRDDAGAATSDFQGPPGAEQIARDGSRDVVTRDRDSAPTDPQKPSNKAPTTKPR